MKKTVAIILSGCGVNDGSEIHESVITLLNINRQNAEYECFAPNTVQLDTVDHLTNTPTNEKRNILVESARISRGNIKPINELNANNFDAIIIPGGFGVIKNLCDFAENGSSMKIFKDVNKILQIFKKQSKPIGLICISPVMAGFLFEKDVKCTIGNDSKIAAQIEATGAKHINCLVTDIVIDEKHKLVTTPAYMLANNLSDIDIGIGKLVTKILEWT